MITLADENELKSSAGLQHGIVTIGASETALRLLLLPEIFAREALAEKEIFRIPLIQQIPERSICFVKNEARPLSIAAGELKKLLLADQSSP